jgi:hypothetical protein
MTMMKKEERKTVIAATTDSCLNLTWRSDCF